MHDIPERVLSVRCPKLSLKVFIPMYCLLGWPFFMPLTRAGGEFRVMFVVYRRRVYLLASGLLVFSSLFRRKPHHREIKALVRGRRPTLSSSFWIDRYRQAGRQAGRHIERKKDRLRARTHTHTHTTRLLQIPRDA